MGALERGGKVDLPGFEPVGNRDLPAGRSMGMYGSKLLVPLRLIDQLDSEEAQRDADEEARQNAAAADLLRKAAEPVAPVDSVPAAAPKFRRVPVFSVANIAAARKRMENHRRDKASKDGQAVIAMRLLDRAASHGGMRALPDARLAAKRVAALASRFENLAKPIEYISTMLALAARQPEENFRVPPVLLVGPPGIGKTLFAQSLSEAIGDIQWRRFSAGQAQGGFQLTGTASGWSNSTPGLVFDMLHDSPWATGIIVIDELDKVRTGDHYPVVPTILDLLADATARTFEDQSLQLRFDASRLIVIGTANEEESIDSALRSRMREFEVQAPGYAQRRRIIEADWAALSKSGRRRVRLDPASIDEAADREDLDLRTVNRAVWSAFARAVLAKGSVAVSLDLPRRPAKRVVGFA